MRNCVIACVLTCFLVGNAVLAEIRTWKARKGNFSVKAELVDVQNGKVELKKEDGTTLSVPLDQLSLADVRYVDQYLKKATESVGKEEKKKPAKSPGKKQSPKDNGDQEPEPSTDEEPALEESSADDEGKASEPEEPSDEMDSSDAEEPAPAEADVEGDTPEKEGSAGKKKLSKEPPLTRPNSTKWQVRIDVISETKARDVSFDVPKYFGLDDLVLPSTPSQFLAGKGEGLDSSIFLWELRTGRRTSAIPIGTSSFDAPPALSPDGDLLALNLYSKPLQIWSLKSKKLVKEIKLSSKDDGDKIRYMAFAGPKRLVINTTYEGRMITIDPRTGAQLAKFETKMSSLDKKAIAISPCGTYIATSDSSEPIRIFDTRNGALAGELAVNEKKKHSARESLRFSPDGQELAVLIGGGLVIECWSTNNGKLVESHELNDRNLDSSSYRTATRLDFIPGKKGWIVDGRAVVDRPKGRVVWKNSDKDTDETSFLRMLDDDHMLVMKGPSDRRRILTMRLPWGEVEKSTALVEKGGKASDAGMPPIKLAGSGGKKAKASEEPRKWHVPLDPLKSAELKPARFKLQDRLKTWEPPRISPQAGSAVVSYQGVNKDGSPNSARPIFQQYDLASGKETAAVQVDFECNLLDVSPDGTRLVLQPSKGEDRLDIYDFAGAKHVVGFRPNQDPDEYRARVLWASLVDNEHLLTCSASYRVVLWSIPECKPVFVFEELRAYRPILSPNRKFLIASGLRFYPVINLKTGETIGTLNAPVLDERMALTGYDFNDDGSKLAMVFNGPLRSALVCWNLATGSQESKHNLANGHDPTWLDDGRILIHSDPVTTPNLQLPPRRADVFELESSRFLWRYKLANGKFGSQRVGGLVWYTSTDSHSRESRLIGSKFPDDNAKAEIAGIKELPELLPKGTPVTLDLNIKMDASLDGILQDALRTKLSNLLIKRGIKVEERTALALRVNVTSEPRMPENGFNAGDRGVKGNDLVCQLELTDVARNKLWGHKRVISQQSDPPVGGFPKNIQPEQFFRQLQWTEGEKWITGEGLPEKFYESWVVNGIGESMLEPTEVKLIAIDAPKK